MGREGLACKRDWSANRAEVLADKQSGWSSLEGNQVYLDIVVGGRREQMRRLVFALFLDEVPLAAANFHALCTHKYGGLGDAGQPLTYKRSCIHRIARGQFLQGGELHGLGSGGDSIYGSGGFEDEPFGLRLRHDAPGLLSMANHGADTNRSQFLITTGACPGLDGTHVVLGRIVSGAFHLEDLEALPVDAADRPALSVEVVECGAIAGWHRAPVPLPEEAEAGVPLDRESLSKQAEQQRSAVASAVSAALGKRAAEGAASSAEGGGEKRRALAAAMDPLAGLGGDDDDDSEED